MNNVAIIGPGAVGSTIAFDLRDASLNVQLLGRRNETLRYHSNNDLHPTYQLDVRALNEYHETVDILFIAVKIPNWIPFNIVSTFIT